MEMRYKEVDRARNIFERYVRCIPTVKSYVRYAKFEMRNGDVVRSRRCYERAVEELGEDAQTVRASCCPSSIHASCLREQAGVLHRAMRRCCDSGSHIGAEALTWTVTETYKTGNE